MDGQGVFDYDEDKRKYQGGFRQGLKHGKGEYYFPNGSRYRHHHHSHSTAAGRQAGNGQC